MIDFIEDDSWKGDTATKPCTQSIPDRWGATIDSFGERRGHDKQTKTRGANPRGV
jgi:hypothetical protein